MSTPNLKEFLQQNGVFRQFCDNLKKHNEESGKIINFDDFIAYQKENGNESDGGLFAFSWAETPENEGFYFWNEIDNRWQKYYYETVRDGKL